jgi:hypothetical protein
MQSTPRLHSRTDHTEARDLRPALVELRRKAWETLLDLGLTEHEIAAYYGVEPGAAEIAAPGVR